MTTTTWRITFTAHGEIAREWTGYASYQEARAALRDADMCIPFHWEHAITEDTSHDAKAR